MEGGERRRGEGAGGSQKKEKEERGGERLQRKRSVREGQSQARSSKPTKASGFSNLVHFILKGQFVYTVYFELFEISLPNHWVCNFRGDFSNVAEKYPHVSITWHE